MHRRFVLLFAALWGALLLITLLMGSALAQNIPAYPEAKDWGAGALNGCRSGLRIAKVTNANTSGAGSLAAAVALADDDTLTAVVFTSGLKIPTATGTLEFGGRCLYIAGQTAPGGGVNFDGRLMLRGASPIRDIVIRYMRLQGGEPHNFLAVKGEDIMLDHLTTRHGGYGIQLGGDTASAPVGYGCVRRVTVQHSFSYEQYYQGTSLGFFVGGEPATEPCTDSISFVANASFDTSHRNFADQVQQTRVLNNLVFNWSQGASHWNGQFRARVERNYYRRGGMTQSSNNRDYEVTTAHPSSSVYCNTAEGGDATCVKQLYAFGNIGPHNKTNPSLSLDASWSGASRMVAWYNIADASDVELSQKSTAPLAWSGGAWPWTIRSDIRLYADSLLDQVGAYQRRNCGAGWTPNRDAADAAEVQEWRDSTGISSFTALGTKVSGLSTPTPAAGTPCTDADADDVPDAWEVAYFGSTTPIGVANRDSITASGYMVFEHYLNGSNPHETLPQLLGSVAVRRFYKLPLVTDSWGRRVPRGWSITSVGGRIYRVGADSALWITYDVLPGETSLTGAALDALCAAHANLNCTELETIHVPGQPSAYLPAAKPEPLLASSLTSHLALAA